MMNDIFKELIDEGVVTIYTDDILCKHCLYLKAEKCTFKQPTVDTSASSSQKVA